MTTVVVVKKAGQVAMAADSLVTFGDTRLPHQLEDNVKIFKVKDSLVGMAGTVAHFPVVRKALLKLEGLNLHGKEAIFDTFTRLHPELKKDFFLQTKEYDSDPYESSQFTLLIANASGIFGVYSYREVFEFKEYWGIGSGRSFALGAMSVAFAKAKTAAEVAKVGVGAGCMFDKNSALPLQLMTLKLKN